MSALKRASSGTFGVVVFGLLVIATVGAFFVTQRLKRSPPVVRKVSLPLYISPNEDGRKDVARIAFFLPKRDRVTVSIVDEGGDEVTRLATDRRLRRGRHRFVWRGREPSGRVPPDATYYLRVVLARQGRATTAPRGIALVTARPRPKLVSATPGRLRPGGPRRVTIRFTGPASPPPLFSVYRTSGAGEPQLVDRFAGLRNKQTALWDATDERGRPVGPGSYAFAVTVQNRARVAGSAPERLPPTALTADRATGVTITGPQASSPLVPVRSGSAARLAIPGSRGQVRWRLERVGGRRPLRRGRGAAAGLDVRVPRRARSGLHVVRFRNGAAAPLVVRGRGAGRVLVVVPTLTWQGLNPVDDDGNGFPNTLLQSPSVALARPFAFGRPPAALARETAPLLTLLDRRRMRYDVTTDLALARGEGPRLAGHRGVLFAGSALWLTERLDSELRDYVEDGGRVASFGADAFRRTVAVSAQRASDPSPPQEANVFGEQTAVARSEAAPLVVYRDTAGLFGGSDGFVGLFTRFEQQQSIVAGARVVAAAGRDPKRPAFVAYRLGRGLVVRVGTAEWGRVLRDDPEVANVTEAVWDQLSR